MSSKIIRFVKNGYIYIDKCYENSSLHKSFEKISKISKKSISSKIIINFIDNQKLENFVNNSIFINKIAWIIDIIHKFVLNLYKSFFSKSYFKFFFLDKNILLSFIIFFFIKAVACLINSNLLYFMLYTIIMIL